MDFKFPDVGEGIGEGKIVSMKVSVGQTVAEDDVLCEVETDKAVVEIPSPTSGLITDIKYAEGDVVKVGEVLMVFDGAEKHEETQKTQQEKPDKIKVIDPDHDRAPERGTAKVESSLTPTTPKKMEQKEESPVATPDKDVKATQGPTSQAVKRVLATPSTRRLARELGVDIHAVNGSGPNGRIEKADVQAAAGKSPAPELPAETQKPVETAEQAPTSPQPAQTTQAPAPVKTVEHVDLAAGEEEEYGGMRKAIGDHMEKSNAVPSFTLYGEADVTLLVELRNHLKPKAEAQGIKLTYLSFFAKAACAALHKHGKLNAHFDGTTIKRFKDIHLGFAVDTERGLLVPVMREADRRSVQEVAIGLANLANDAREGKLPKEYMSGSTFSISSIGPMRVDRFTPMINTPEVGILGIGAIEDRPWVVNGEVKPRKVVSLSLTLDHRIIDGAEGSRFMKDLIELIEDPELFLLEGI